MIALARIFTRCPTRIAVSLNKIILRDDLDVLEGRMNGVLIESVVEHTYDHTRAGYSFVVHIDHFDIAQLDE